jgi:hypothetical protein
MDRLCTIASSWLVMLAVTVPLALLLLLALPSGLPWHIAWHVVLLVGGAAISLALVSPGDDDDP